MCIHMALEFDITGDFFRIKLGLQKSVSLLFFNFSLLNYIHMPFKAYIYTHSEHSAQFLFQFLLRKLFL